MTATEWVFWGSLLLVAHTYLLYPVSLFVMYALEGARRDWSYLRTRTDRRLGGVSRGELPAVSLIIAAHNEAQHLPAKLANLAQLDYPRDRLEVIVVSDASTDGTNAILQRVEDPTVHTVLLPVRGGKCNALNHGVAQVKHDILVFSDAATMFAPDAVAALVRPFADSKVGVVCGALQFEGSAESRQTEGVYWSYENMLRLMEARLGVTLTASGAIYAVRRQCFPMLHTDTLTEDLVVPLAARRLGYRVVFEPEAQAVDFAASTVAGEFTRRVRVATGSFRSLRDLTRTPMSPLTAFAFFSHKFLRWMMPFLLLGLLASSAVLWARPFYRAALVGQGLFYLWAGLGYLGRHRVRGVRYALIAYYLVAIHLAYLVGFVRVVTGRRQATWQRVG